MKVDGAQCPCGRRGCMEADAGRNALEARVRELHDKGEPTELFKIAKKAWPRAPDERHLGGRA